MAVLLACVGQIKLMLWTDRREDKCRGLPEIRRKGRWRDRGNSSFEVNLAGFKDSGERFSHALRSHVRAQSFYLKRMR